MIVEKFKILDSIPLIYLSVEEDPSSTAVGELDPISTLGLEHQK